MDKMSKIFYIISGVMLVLFCGILLIDRQSLNHAYSKIGAVIEEKDQHLQKMEIQHKIEQEKLREKLQQQQRIFHIVTAHRSLQQSNHPEDGKNALYPELENLGPQKFTQFNGEKELQEMAQKLAELVEKPVHAGNVIKAFNTHAKALLPRQKFLTDPQNPQRMINLEAALFEALCDVLGYQYETVLCWNMATMKHFFRTGFTSPKNKTDHGIFHSGDQPEGQSSANTIIRQDEAISVLLPFQPFKLDKNDHYEIMTDFHKIPVGGLYLHRIDVLQNPESTATEWCLEYSFEPAAEPAQPGIGKNEFPSSRKPAVQTTLRALSLIPGAKIISSSSKGLQTFRIPFINGRSSLLILGDTPVLPRRITARSVTAD